MKIIKVLGGVALVVLGAGVIFYGGMDDSPGAQMLGLLVAIGGFVAIIKTLKKVQ